MIGGIVYLSRMELCPYIEKTAVALERLSLLHAAIECSFSEKQERNLWRIDQVEGRLYVLIVSRQKPDLTYMYKQFGDPNISPNWKIAEYEPFIEKIEDGSAWHFRLVVNPTRSVTNTTHGQRGVVRAVQEDKLSEWLEDHSTRNGFSTFKSQYRVVTKRWIDFQKKIQNPQHVKFLSVTYEGILTVTDKSKFVETLVTGIGREKVYGHGMLTIVPISRMIPDTTM